MHKRTRVLFLTAALAFAGPRSFADGESGKAEARAQALAERLFAPGASAESPAVLGGKLAQLGPDIVPELFEVLAAEGGETRVLTDTQRAACLECARRLGSAEVADFVDVRSKDVETTGERAALLQLAAASGRPRLLGVVAGLAYRETDGEDLDPLLRRRLEEAAAELFERSPTAARELPTLLGSAPLPVRKSLLRAASQIPGRAVLEGLERVLDAGHEHRAFLVSIIGKCAERCSRPYPEGVRSWVRGLLEASDAQLQREAALTCGRLGDDESVEELVRLLDHALPSVREAALYSLHRITEEPLTAEPELWQAWLERERAWELDERPELLRDLESPRTARVLRSLNELAKRRFGREALAAHVVRLVDHEREEVRLRACETLRSLGACRDMEPLAEALDDVSPGVRAAAWSALRGLTGWELSADPRAWQRSLEAGTPVQDAMDERPDLKRSSERRSAAFFRL